MTVFTFEQDPSSFHYRDDSPDDGSQDEQMIVRTMRIVDWRENLMIRIGHAYGELKNACRDLESLQKLLQEQEIRCFRTSSKDLKRLRSACKKLSKVTKPESEITF